MENNTNYLPISKLLLNSGQIDGVPKNPRHIKDIKYEKLKQSIQDDPEMLELRELLVYPHGDKFVIIGGNMRYRAARDLGHKEMPVKFIPEDTPAKKLRAIVMKDNIGYGEHSWDDISSEWDAQELEDWGLDIPGFDVDVEEKEPTEAKEKDTHECPNCGMEFTL